MNKKIESKKVGLYGLISNFFGSMILAVSFLGTGGMIKSPRSGIEYYIAHISEYGFKIGLFFLAFGFVLQFWEKKYQDDVEVYLIVLSFLVTVFIYFLFLSFIPKLLFI